MSAPEADIRMRQSVKQALTEVIFTALSDGKSLSLWRLPDSSTKHLLIADTVKLASPTLTLEELPAGFLVSPFDPATARYFLPADALFTIHNESIEQIKGQELPVNGEKTQSSFYHAKENPAPSHTQNEIGRAHV